MAPAGSLGFIAARCLHDFDSLTLIPHRLAWPDGASSTPGNSSTFHDIHFLAGNFFGLSLSGGIGQLLAAFDKNKTLIVIAF